MNPTRLLLLALCLTSYLVVPPVLATSVVPMELPELVSTSTVIVHGEVIGSSCRWNDDRSLILTDVRLLVRSAVKGEPPAEVVFTQPGGTVGKLRVDVAGARPFPPGGEVVVFLAEGPRGDLFVTGLSQGRLDVVEDPATGRKSVQSPILNRPAASGTTGVETAAEFADRGLERFLRRVGRLVEDIKDEGGR